MAFKFKSTGFLPDVEQQIRPSQEITAIGFKTPLELGHGAAGLFKMHTDMGKAIRDNLRNLLLTNRGERLMSCDLGADLRALATELQDDGDTTALEQISNTVAKFMPFVRLETLVPKMNHLDNARAARLSILITYSVPTLGLTDQAVQVNINFMG